MTQSKIELADIILELEKLYQITKEGTNRSRYGGALTAELAHAEYQHLEATLGWTIKELQKIEAR